MEREQAITVITLAGYGADLERLLELLASMPQRTAIVLDHLLDVVLFEEPGGAAGHSKSTAATRGAGIGRRPQSD
jgi:hypothetical protein